jgi:fimbrial chaperone protein
MSARPLRTFLFFLLLASCLGGMARAANLQISPVTLRLRADQGAAGIELQNLGQAPIYGQVRVYVWDQQGGEDVLTPTQQLVASPPIVQIGARAAQTIRLVRTGAAPAGTELSYRVLIDELARDDGPASTGVDIRLRYSVPVFVLPAAPGGETLRWKVSKKEGGWVLRVDNSGSRHAQIGALSLSTSGGAQFVISKGLFGYVLAGRWREWRLPVVPPADLSGVLAVSAVINAKPVQASAQGD